MVVGEAGGLGDAHGARLVYLHVTFTEPRNFYNVGTKSSQPSILVNDRVMFSCRQLKVVSEIYIRDLCGKRFGFAL